MIASLIWVGPAQVPSIYLYAGRTNIYESNIYGADQHNLLNNRNYR